MGRNPGKRFRVNPNLIPHESNLSFARWLRSAPADKLYNAWESGHWTDPEQSHPIYGSLPYRLDFVQIQAAKVRLAHVIWAEHGGAFSAGPTVIRSDGKRVWAELRA